VTKDGVACERNWVERSFGKYGSSNG
jgi:hypothetical protein